MIRAQTLRRRRRLVGTLLTALALYVGIRVATSGGSTAQQRGSDITTSQGTAVNSRVFASGACQAFAPTSGNRNTTVFLDAGHGGLDPGALGTTQSGQSVTEASLTLPIELDAMALLRADGYRVVVSRTADTNVLRLGPQDISGQELSLQGAHDDVAARAVCADDAGAAVLVGIYLDAGASTSNAGSLAAYDTVRSFAARNQQLATVVEQDVVASMNAHGWQIPDDGVVSDTQVGSVSGNPDQGGIAAQAAAYDHLLLLGPAQAGYFSTPSTMPGTVVEPVFITDPFEASVVDNTPGQQAVAAGVASAVEQFLAPPKTTTSSTTAGA